MGKKQRELLWLGWDQLGELFSRGEGGEGRGRGERGRGGGAKSMVLCFPWLPPSFQASRAGFLDLLLAGLAVR